MAGRKQDDYDLRPSKPGWYPDPWSADGRGERYFDGKKWGTSERPVPREATVTQITSRRPARVRMRPFGPVLIFAAAVLAVWGVGRLRHSGHTNAVRTVPSIGSPEPTVTVPGVTFHLSAGPPPGVEEHAAPLGRPAPVPAGNGKYAIERSQPKDSSVPVAFDPCRPIHYVVNPAGSPSDGAQLIRSAVARVHAATGLRFVDDGPTTEPPRADRPAYQPDRYPGRWAPVLIAWSDEHSYKPLAGDVAGIGQSVAAKARSGRLAYVSGQVVLDDGQLSAARVTDRADVRAVLLHELGHLVGLDHTSDRRQLMFSESQFNVTDYANGDLRGLALLGTQSCFRDL